MKRANIVFGRVYSQGYRRKLSDLLRYGGSDQDATQWLGNILIMNIGLVLALLLIFWLSDYLLIQPLFSIGILVGSSALLQALAYVLPYYASERRAKAVEASLPSFYQLVASYLRSGMTPFQALKSASKREFGVLKDEIDLATSRALGTASFSDALLDISNRINSENLQRSTELMVRGIDSGGSLAKMLDESAANLIENKSLRRQIVAASRTYTLMVVFAVIIGAPLLLSISTRFNERLIDLTQNIDVNSANIQGLELGLIAGDVSIDPQNLINIAMFMIFMTSLISSFLVGIIIDGKEKYGLKYAVLFVPLSMGLFFAFRTALLMFF